MRKLLSLIVCVVAGISACEKDTTPTEPPASNPPPAVVATPTPSVPMSVLGVSPRQVPLGAKTEITVAGSGFTFPLQVLLRSGQHSLELNVELLSINFIRATAQVSPLSGIPVGPADLEVFSPKNGQRVICPACISVTQ